MRSSGDDDDDDAELTISFTVVRYPSVENGLALLLLASAVLAVALEDRYFRKVATKSLAALSEHDLDVIPSYGPGGKIRIDNFRRGYRIILSRRVSSRRSLETNPVLVVVAMPPPALVARPVLLPVLVLPVNDDAAAAEEAAEAAAAAAERCRALPPPALVGSLRAALRLFPAPLPLPGPLPPPPPDRDGSLSSCIMVGCQI
mmetsp:Transcript_14547/g.31525  ORF Transcript_14547/g.31525 Transcript_14547/m.31525 type:complete len:202 (-) Transcript_14547:42-647(-)